jgi:hypothetical protein
LAAPVFFIPLENPSGLLLHFVLLLFGGLLGAKLLCGINSDADSFFFFRIEDELKKRFLTFSSFIFVATVTVKEKRDLMPN